MKAVRAQRAVAAAGARGTRPLPAVLAAALSALLGACTAPPIASSSDGDAPTRTAGPSVQGAERSALRPLARQPGTPSDAPRSVVPPVRYDLNIGRGEGELPPDDGLPGDAPPGEVIERGGASWYGIQFHQRKTANGERFDMGALTAAHKTLPFNTLLCVRSLVNGKEVLVRINDRGPYAAGRIIDLSQAAAEKIDMIGLGIKQVMLTRIRADGGRCGGEKVEPTQELGRPHFGVRATPADTAHQPARRGSRAKPQPEKP